MLRAKTKLGQYEVWVEKETLEDLIEELAYIDSLQEAAEGRPGARIVRRDIPKKAVYLSFVTGEGDDQEVVDLGEYRDANARPGRKYFAYAQGSPMYKGFTKRAGR